MDELSILLHEAKPLYKKRKRNKLMVKSALVLVIPLMLFTSALNLYFEGNDIYIAMNSNSFQMQLLEDDFGLK